MQNTMLDSMVPVSNQELSNRTVCVLGVRGYEEDGVAHLHIEDVSRGLGFTEQKDNAVYVKWSRVESHLDSLGFDTSVENENPHDYYIPENIFYRLCMKARNEVAEAFQAKVADEIIPSIRKTGSYSVTQTQSVQPTIYDYARALIAEKERSDALEAQNKALTAERDEAIRTKAMIGSRREAKAMATASAKSKECAKLTAENADLKDAVGRGTNWRTVAMMTDEWKREFGHAPSYHKLQKFSADLPTEMQPVKDVEVKVVLKNGSEKVNLVNRYHREAWAKYREFEENLRVSAESRRDASNEGIGLNDTDTDLEVF